MLRNCVINEKIMIATLVLCSQCINVCVQYLSLQHYPLCNMFVSFTVYCLYIVSTSVLSKYITSVVLCLCLCYVIVICNVSKHKES